MKLIPKVAIIDAHALIHRAFHALPPMSTSNGRPTQAIYGFTSMLLKVFSIIKPTHVVAAFDMPGPTLRHLKFADYKAHRVAPPADLITQFEGVREVLSAFGIPIVEKKQYEADDVIGTLVRILGNDVKKVIVTGDMDALQLVDDSTTVFTMKRGVTNTMMYTREAVLDQFGFEPSFIVDYKGLRGDPSDNIPGVLGVGEKTAKELVASWGSIENIYKHIDDILPRAQRLLRGHKQDALFSKELATIKTDVPFAFSLEDARVGSFDTENVFQIMSKYGFRSLLSRLPRGSHEVQPTIFRIPKESSSQMLSELPNHYHLVRTIEEEQDLEHILSQSTLIAFDTETESLGARIYPIVGMSFAVKQGSHIEAWYVPVNRRGAKRWRGILENPHIQKIGHNLKYDYEVVRQSDILLSGIVFDTMVAAYLLNPGSRQYSLDTLALEELNYHTIPISHLIGSGRDVQLMSQVRDIDVARYACEDADVSYRLFEKFAPKIREEGLTSILEEIEIPLVPVLAEMELAGVAVDRAALRALKVIVEKKVKQLTQSIWKHASKTFNISSTQQLRDVLFTTLNLPTVGIKRTQTGFSTAASELEKLRGAHPVVARIEEYRELTKLLNTYIETLPELIDPRSHRIHTSFNQTVAATGRLSSTDPNLQNIPVRTKVGREIRRCFVTHRGRRLIKADYSQLELRIAAHLSGDQRLLDVFRKGGDIHASTAAWVYDVPQHEVTPEQRRKAKTLNFGVLYGMGPQSFAAASAISVEEARIFIGRYRDQFRTLLAYAHEVLESARERKYVETLFGRRRPIPEIQSNNPAVKSQAERIAFNFPIQGTEADILKMAMIKLYQHIKETYEGSLLVLTVHDELVCEVAKDDVQAFAKDMKHVMEQVVTLDVPLVVDVSVGKNWNDVEPLS